MSLKLDNDNRFTEIYPGIYSSTKFFKPSLLSKFYNKLSEINSDKWDIHYNTTPGDIEGTYWDNKLSVDMIGSSFHDTLINFLAPEYWILSNTNFVRLAAGEEGPLFTSEKEEIFKYKVAVYLGNWSGGEIVFPEIDFKYAPGHGEMLIFKNEKMYSHYTNLVTEGVRYAYVDYIFEYPPYFMP